MSSNSEAKPLAEEGWSRLALWHGSLLAVVTMACLAGIFLVDRPLAELVRSWDSAIHYRFLWLSELGHGRLPILATVVFYILFRFAFKRPAAASRCLYIGSALLATTVVVNVLKIFFGRARPLLLREDIYGFDFFRLPADWRAFPSGHAGNIFVIACCCAIIMPRFRVPFFVAAAIIALARVGANAHYLSDVVAGSYIAVVISLALAHLFTGRGAKLPIT